MTGGRVRAPARVNTGSSRYAVLRRQIPFAVVAIVAVLTALTWAPQVFTDGALLVPLVLAFTATILAAAVPWPKLPRMAAMTVPLLNMLAIAFAQLAGLPASPWPDMTWRGRRSSASILARTSRGRNGLVT